MNIRDALLDANIVCLKREVAISRGQSVECTATRKFTQDDGCERLEVWVGSGETEQSQISWFTLGAVKKQVCHHRYFSPTSKVLLYLQIFIIALQRDFVPN